MDRAANLRFCLYEIGRPRELFEHGARIRLRPQPVQVLDVLACHSGEVDRTFGAVVPMVIAHAAMGNTDEAIAWLKTGSAEHSNAGHSES